MNARIRILAALIAVQQNDIKRILALNPRCTIHMRPYLDPNRLGDRNAPNYAPLWQYIDECKRFMDDWRGSIPEGQRYLSVFNEQNMPRWSGWEGFGDQLADMQAFDEWFCRAYEACKAHDPSWIIPWSPLTPGNRDVWFSGDMAGHYYMHGPEGCRDTITETQRQTAIATSPCRASLLRADAYYAHVYIHEGQGAWNEPWRGRRIERLARFFSKPMDMWIKEAGYPTRAHMQEPWVGPSLIEWIKAMAGYSYVRGLSLWMLGTHDAWGRMWYDGDKPRKEVYQLAEFLNGQATPPPAKPAPQPLPEHEPDGAPAFLAEKCRWWLEEEQRQREAGNTERANAIRLSLIKLQYRLEDKLKSA